MKDLINKMAEYGPSSLSNIELMTIVFGDVRSANAIATHVGGSLNKLSSCYASELAALPGVTKRKAYSCVAAVEFARRRGAEEKMPSHHINCSRDIAFYLREKIGDSPVEVFYVLFMNRANKIVHGQIVSQGGYTGTVADPRVILKLALEYKAVNIVLAHNHPSGSIKPSRADEQLTTKIKEAAKYFDMAVIDHLIITGGNEYYSFADEGLI